MKNPDETLIIGSIRDPVDHVSSTFRYFINDPPFKNLFTSSAESAIADFYQNPRSYLSKTNKVPKTFKLKNYQAFDFGYADPVFQAKRPLWYDSDPDFVRKIDQNFDLILVSSRLDESLVILSILMRWPISDVCGININVQPRTRKIINEDTANRILSWNTIDLQLYKLANEKLDRLIAIHFKDFKPKIKEFIEACGNCNRNKVDNFYAKYINLNFTDCELENLTTKQLGFLIRNKRYGVIYEQSVLEEAESKSHKCLNCE